MVLSPKFWEREYPGCYDLTHRHVEANRELMERVVRRSNASNGASVLDVCSGTGNMALACETVNSWLKLTLVDNSPGMLKRARKKARRYNRRARPYGGSARIVRADLNGPWSWGLDPTQLFDGALDCNGGYTLDDFAAALRGIAKLVKPNGFLIQTVPRAGANIEAIFKAEVERRVDLTGKDAVKVAERLKRQLRRVIECNKQILEEYGPRLFTEDEIRAVYESSGWEIVSLETAYCDTNWFIVARRRAI